MNNNLSILVLMAGLMILSGCFEDIHENRGFVNDETAVEADDFYFGADLSYVNQILDHGGVYKNAGGTIEDPYAIFQDNGTNLVRLRLWNNPQWTQEVYEDGTQLYNDIEDVALAIKKSQDQGMKVLLDFHFSDTWADPGHQEVPAAWSDITDINDLGDSVYNYVHKTLDYLNGEGLMPELVQLGNETNCGMMLTGGNDDFPALNVCDGNWANLAVIANRGIEAIRAIDSDTKILFHVADPKNLSSWFSAMINNGVSDFDMIGFSYYPLWHTQIAPSKIEETVAGIIEQFNKEVIILETAYPWTTEGNDSYNNLMGGDPIIEDYAYTPDGQKQFLIDLTQSLKNAGASGVVYWEPAWITSDMKDQWGTGSAWENNAFFDFDGVVNTGFDFMTYEYEGE